MGQYYVETSFIFGKFQQISLNEWIEKKKKNIVGAIFYRAISEIKKKMNFGVILMFHKIFSYLIL